MTSAFPVAPRWFRYVGVVACAATILAASMVDPGEGASSTFLGVRITVYLHLLAYAGLAGAVGYARLAADRRTLFATAVVATLYGAAVELVQGTLSYRTMSLLDATVNAGGATAGALLWRIVAPCFGAPAGTTPLSASTE